MPTAPRHVIEVTNLRFGWNASAVIDVAHLNVGLRERVFLRGPSGSGKSTLLSLIAGMAVPQEGKVEVLEHDIGAMSGAARDQFRADHIGFIFQLFNLIPYLSVIENVCLPCGFSERRREHAVQAGGSVRAQARQLLEQLGMGPVLQRPVTQLSVGQQQRVAAARALIGGPEIIIADEPTSALDTDRRTQFVDLLFRECERQGAALLFVSHDAALASRFHRSIELGDINRARQPGETASSA